VAAGAVCAFLIAVPFVNSVARVASAHDMARIAQWILAVVCAAALLGQSFEAEAARRRLRSHAVGALLVVAAALGLASAISAPAPEWAFREIAVGSGMAVVALVVADANQPQLRSVAWAVVGGATLYGASMVVFSLVGMTLGYPPNLNWFGHHYANYRHFNHVQTVALPLLAAIAATTAERRLRQIAYVGLATQTALLLFLAGRGTLLAITVSTVLVVLLFGRAARGYLRQIALGAVAGACLWLLVFRALPWALGLPNESGLRVTDSGSDSARWALWSIAYQDIQRFPWLGSGPMHFAHALSHTTRGDTAHPHNIYVQVASEWGLPFVVVVLALAAMGFGRLVSAVRACASRDTASGRTGDALMGTGLVAAVIAIAVDGLVSGNFAMPVSQVWIAVTLGWAAAWLSACEQRRPDSSAPQLARPWGWRSIAGLLLLAQIWLAWSAHAQALDLETYLRSARQLVPTALANPRFWSHGWF
jgi:hypothetical protein